MMFDDCRRQTGKTPFEETLDAEIAKRLLTLEASIFIASARRAAESTNRHTRPPQVRDNP
jgi:hypothetical protein